MKLATLLFSLLFLFTCADAPLPPELLQTEPIDSRSFLMGFTPFPWAFTAEAVEETLSFVRRHGDLISLHIEQGVPWPEALEEKPYHPNLMDEWKTRKENAQGKTVFLSLNAIANQRDGLANYRGEKEGLPLPPKFAGMGFDHPHVKKAYFNFCSKAADYFQPGYFAIGIEINELHHNRPDLWPGYVELYRETYAKLKALHPTMKIFATVTLHNLLNQGWEDREANQREIQKLADVMDIMGVSFYPFMAGFSAKPMKELQWLNTFTDKPIAISETGHLAETLRLDSFNLTIQGSPEAQQNYYHTLLSHANQNSFEFVVSYLYRDYDELWEMIKNDAPEAFKVWKDCGMVDERGNPRPALDVWNAYYQTPVK